MYLSNNSSDCAIDCGSDFCVCQKGYVLNDLGECVSPAECDEYKDCDEENGEVWTNCKTDCEETCDIYGKSLAYHYY